LYTDQIVNEQLIEKKMSHGIYFFKFLATTNYLEILDSNAAGISPAETSLIFLYKT